MSEATIAQRLDVVICALRGAGLEPDVIRLSPADRAELGPLTDWRGTTVEGSQRRSYVLVIAEGSAERAPLRLKAFARWLDGRVDPPGRFPAGAAQRLAS